MQKNIQYNNQSHSELFMDEWLPHREASDIWQIEGILNEPDSSQPLYSFNLSISKVNYPFESFYAIHYSLGEIFNAQDHSEDIVIPIRAGRKTQLTFDEDSCFCGDIAQILDTEKAVVLRLRGKDFSLELRMNKDYPLVWYGQDGKVSLSRVPKNTRSMFSCIIPRMCTYGRLNIGDRDFRVQGIAAFERSWGKMPLKLASTHWEKFYLFFDDMDEMSLINIPLADHMDGVFMHHNLPSMPISEFDLQPTEYLEIDEWRFSSKWQLNIPAINRGPYYLIPLIKSQFTLPVCRPFIGIYDSDGKRYGYGHAELQPGARNELDTISLSLFKNVYPEA